MTTVADLIKDTLQEIIVAGSEAPIEADDAAIFIRRLNAYMASLEASGVDLGYAPVSSVSDILPLPDGAIDPLIAIMAIRMAPTYGATPSMETKEAAREGKTTLLKLGMTILPTQYPADLPIGSGNEGDYNGSTAFYGTDE